MEVKASFLFAPNFLPVFKSVMNHEYTYYTLSGGRGSCKSSFISLVVIILMLQNRDMNAVVLRKHANTLRESVFEQIQWAIDTLGLSHKFRCTVSPMKIEYISTGQTIYFKGVDDARKIKSLKVKKGYFGITWFEESCEFTPDEMRDVRLTTLRGGSVYYIFESFNPPVSAKNWKNTELLATKKDRLVHKSDYRTVSVEWLGEAFINEAEHLLTTNERMYRNVFLGEATGTGDNIFENVELRQITDEEIKAFDFIYRGIDWGFYPDPFAYGEMCYNAEKKELYIFKELYLLKSSNWNAHEKLLEIDCDQKDRITADSAEPKSVADFREWGWNMKGAIKGKGSLEYGFKWLQSLNKIVIDTKRCPKAAAEFLEYEYEKDRDGEVLSGYPQGQADHYMALTRYALESVWRQRGM